MRRLIGRNALAAVLLVLMALAVRVAVPVGFMPAATASGVAIVPCPADAALPPAIHGGMAGMHHSHGHGKADGADSTCPFAGLSLPALGGADAVQIAAAAVVTLALGLRPAAARPWRLPPYLRPPLRGPPSRG